MNSYLKNGNVSFGNVLIIIHNISQCNESISFNGMDKNVENDDVSVGHCFMKSHTLNKAKNSSYIYNKIQRD